MLKEKVKNIIEDPDSISDLTQKETKELLKKVNEVFEKEQKLIELYSGSVIFVGDTHGDFDATKNIIKKFFQDNKLVFLGDYLDRGKQSKENVNFLLTLKLTYPEKVFLLQGNHEGYGIFKFYPADFWEGLDKELCELYARLLLNLPLAVSTENIICLHGVLPQVKNLSDINRIKVGSEEWKQITWGDFQERRGKYLGIDTWTGRPQFGKDYFDEMMKKFKKNVLIRSHQPDAKEIMFNRRCLTIFTSHAYMPRRTVAIANLEKEIKTVDDLIVEEI